MFPIIRLPWQTDIKAPCKAEIAHCYSGRGTTVISASIAHSGIASSTTKRSEPCMGRSDTTANPIIKGTPAPSMKALDPQYKQQHLKRGRGCPETCLCAGGGPSAADLRQPPGFPGPSLGNRPQRPPRGPWRHHLPQRAPCKINFHIDYICSLD